MTRTPRDILRTPIRRAIIALALAGAANVLAQPGAEAPNPFDTSAQSAPVQSRVGGSYSPYAEDSYPRRLLWGDTHLHSSQSLDANSAGNERLPPAAAYRFARGEAVTAHNGMRVKLQRPLDFLVVSDHAEYLGLIAQLKAGDPALGHTAAGRELLARFSAGVESATKLMHELAFAFMNSDPRFDTKNFTFDNWRRNAETADQFNDPGVFTTLIGYEWTSFPRGDNLHRVVVYRDGADKAAAMPPFSALDGMTPEALWAGLAEYEAHTGGRVLAIPHNGNVSNGLMFTPFNSDGKALSKEENRIRARWEPVVEVTQIKGDGETHPLLSPDDDFADFETWDEGNLNPVAMVPKQPGMLRYEYARSALQLGLEQRARTGINPFKFGMIGSTDAHTSLATAAENNFWGKVTALEPGTERRDTVFFRAAEDSDAAHIFAWQQVASGYAAVWATDNTREAIFDAMMRREVYATTGSRITLRLFGGWQFAADQHLQPDLTLQGYRLGVPMGADLPALPSGGAVPSFLIQALKDPDGANLDRIQVVKGWRDRKGELHERVYNVAVSDQRPINADGSVPPLPATLTDDNTSYSNRVGATQLATVWQDPDFDPRQHAFYYVRVLEIPTPRWTEFDRLHFGGDTPAAPRYLQDRAYSSPIWYTP